MVVVKNDPLASFVTAQPTADRTRTARLRGLNPSFYGSRTEQKVRVSLEDDARHYLHAFQKHRSSKGGFVANFEPEDVAGVSSGPMMVSNRLPDTMFSERPTIFTPYWDVVGPEQYIAQRAATDADQITARTTQAGRDKFVVAGQYRLTVNRDQLGDVLERLDDIGPGVDREQYARIQRKHLGVAPNSIPYLPVTYHQYPQITGPSDNSVSHVSPVFHSGYENPAQVPSAQVPATMPVHIPNGAGGVPISTVIPLAPGQYVPE
jgi:hypothetical protein